MVLVYAAKNCRRRRAKARLSDRDFLAKKVIELKRRPTAAEAVFMRRMEGAGQKYVFQFDYIIGGLKGIIDFYLQDLNIFVEVDGGYHNKASQIQTDSIKDWVVQSKFGKPLVRITNEQAINTPIEQLLAIFTSAVFVPVQITQLKGYAHGKKCYKCPRIAHFTNGSRNWCIRHFNKWKTHNKFTIS